MPHNNLPAEVSDFVGRDQEAALVVEGLGEHRLVTLAGVGGVGKTRLALQVARRLTDSYSDGAAFVELAHLGSGLAQAVLDALGAPARSTGTAEEILLDHLRGRQVLLLLDSCERVAEAVARMLEPLLREAHDVRILVTSQRPLGLDGEHVVQVQPLPLRADAAAEAPAVELFVRRAQTVVPGFVLSPENDSTVRAICARLEGIPLALELAAVRLRVLSLDELADRLDSGLGLLTRGPRDAPPRHRALSATIDWSYALCDLTEQTLWARMSVFRGSFSRATVAEVCAGDQVPPETFDQTLASLVDKSVLAREEASGTTRYRMLEALREYGHARLRELGQDTILQRRHRDWFVGFGDRFDQEWFGPDQVDLHAALHRERRNLRAALEFTLSRPAESRLFFHMASSQWFGELSYRFPADYADLVDRGLALDPTDSADRAGTLTARGFVALGQRDPRAEAFFREAQRTARAVGDAASEASALQGLGTMAMFSGSPESAVALLDEAAVLGAEGKASTARVVAARLTCGLSQLFAGQLEAAVASLDGVRQEAAASGELVQHTSALACLGLLALLRGDLLEAEELELGALSNGAALWLQPSRAFALEVLAWTLITGGRHRRGAAMLGVASTFWRFVGGDHFGSREFSDLRDDVEVKARTALGDEEFEAAFIAGQELPADRAIAFALNDDDLAAPEPPSGPLAELTPREREIAELVSDGLTNREIAERLVISRRTAEGHVDRILSKLGFSSRTQIIAWVSARRGAGSAR